MANEVSAFYKAMSKRLSTVSNNRPKKKRKARLIKGSMPWAVEQDKKAGRY